MEEQELKTGETKWIPLQRKNTLIGKTIMTVIKASFRDHIYEFGELFRQTKGGAICVPLTEEVAKIIMER